MTATLTAPAKAQFRRVCNGYRRQDWTIRGATIVYADRLLEVGCVYDKIDRYWLAPSKQVLDEVATWPGIYTGTPGPRMPSGPYRGWPAWLVPVYYAQQVMEIGPSGDPELIDILRQRARGVASKRPFRRPAPEPQPQPQQPNPVAAAWDALPQGDRHHYLAVAAYLRKLCDHNITAEKWFEYDRFGIKVECEGVQIEMLEPLPACSPAPEPAPVAPPAASDATRAQATPPAHPEAHQPANGATRVARSTVEEIRERDRLDPDRPRQGRDRGMYETGELIPSILDRLVNSS